MYAAGQQKPPGLVCHSVKFGVGELAVEVPDGGLLRRARGAAAQRVAGVETVNQVVLNVNVLAHSFSSLAMISFMISDVPAPMVLSRKSRHMRPTGYSVV